jgi:hypothetical protein
MAKPLSFSRHDDRDIEVANLCLDHGCHDCPGYDDSKDGVLVVCMHGCHELEASLSERIRRGHPDVKFKA